MKQRDLRRLGRRDLLKILLQVQRENEALTQEIAELREKQALPEGLELGSIAEAALQLNHVFEAAQQAADQYVAAAKALCPPQDESQEEPQEDPQEETDDGE